MIFTYKFIKLINQKSLVQSLKRQKMPYWKWEIKTNQKLKMNHQRLKKVPLQVKRNPNLVKRKKKMKKIERYCRKEKEAG